MVHHPVSSEADSWPCSRIKLATTDISCKDRHRAWAPSANPARNRARTSPDTWHALACNLVSASNTASLEPTASFWTFRLNSVPASVLKAITRSNKSNGYFQRSFNLFSNPFRSLRCLFNPDEASFLILTEMSFPISSTKPGIMSVMLDSNSLFGCWSMSPLASISSMVDSKISCNPNIPHSPTNLPHHPVHFTLALV